MDLESSHAMRDGSSRDHASTLPVEHERLAKRHRSPRLDGP
jgi:hypothetical protein